MKIIENINETIKEIEENEYNETKDSEIVFQETLSHNYRALKYGQL